MSSSNPNPTTPLTFYDIATRPPVQQTCCSPNPWKARLALNFKSVPYTTKWVPLPDVAKVRTALHIPACRKFADGTDFHTLPILHDPTTNTTIGESFDIAVHLQRTYPTSGAGDLFPPQLGPTLLEFKHELAVLVPLSERRAGDDLFPAYAHFNQHVDAAFSAHVQLTTQGFPFDPATEEVTKAEFVRRAGAGRWEDFALEGEARRKMMESFEKMLGELGRLFEKGGSGPFLMGERASYADLIVGAWLRMLSRTLPEGEWKEVKGWHGGLFGRFHDALEVYAEVK